MKTLTCALLTLLAAAPLSGCGGRGSGATIPAQAAPAAVTGVDTPKSVSVVTAN
ncbi:MAG TPA: hypothetical protein VNR70_03755 [Steroidobacteraceae bacterium]|nr:hypothetical protein [Steroidobacteraceae bacterium]